MAQTYTRQSSMSDGDTITAALFNNEYNQLLNAFAYSSSSASSTGHRHDGTAAQGGNIHTIGDLDFLNKIVADSTNNRWGVFVEVSSAAVEQIRISDGVISPVTDNDVDLGTSSLEFKDLFIDGTAHVDTLDVDVNGTVAGTFGVTGATTLSSTLAVTGAVTGSSTIQGTTITATTAFVPDASDGAALGTSALEFSDLFLADGAVINFGDDQDVSLTHVADTGLLISSTDQLQFGDSGTYIYQSADGVLDLVSDTEIEINATTIDINGNVDVSGTLTVAGAVDFGDAALSNVGAVQLDSIAGDGDTNTSITFSGSDVITITAGGDTQFTFNNGSILPTTDNDIDLGSSSYEFKDGYFDGTVYADAINFNGTAIAATAAELNIVDGDTSASSTTLADADRVVVNDNGTMKQVALTDFETYFESSIDTIANFEVTTELQTPLIAFTDGDDAIQIADGGGVTMAAGLTSTAASNTLGATSFNDADITNVGAVQLDSIAGDGDTNTSITFSGSDVITIATGGSGRLTIGDGALSPVTDNEIDLGTSSLEFKDAFFDGTVTSDAFAGPLTGNVTGTASLATSITASANNSTDETVYPAFVDGATGTQGIETDTGLTYNPSTGMLTSTGVTSTFTGNITGNVTGNTSGTAATVTTAAQTNITSLGTLTALTVDDVAINGKVITMTGSSSDTATITAGTNGTLDIVTTDDAAAAANIQITADGTAELAGTTVTLDSGGGITLDADSGTITFADGGSSLGTITSSGYSGTSATVTVTDSTANTNFPIVFHNESNGLLDDTGALRYNPSTGTLLAPNLSVAGTTTTVDTVTMEASNAIIFEGATADSNETTLSIVDPTADHTQYLINQGGYIPVLAAATTTAISSTPAELNLLDGSSAGTVANSKAVIYSSDGDITVGDNLALTSDSAEVTFGADSEVKIIHTADTGLILKHTATADDKPISLTLQTGETDMAANDVIGKINFQAPDEGTGTDAILVAAGIQAISEGDFSSSSNATSLQFMTGASEAATAKMTVTSGGKVGIANTSPDVSLDLGSNTDAVHVPAGTTGERPGSPAAGYFRYNSTTGKFEGYTDEWGSIGGGAGTNMDTNTYTGDGSDTTFTLSTGPDDEENLMVFIDGVFQAHDTFSVSGTTLTFATAPANGRVITVYHSTTTVGGSNNTINTMTGDASDTTLTLSVAPVHENNVQVFFDGVYQSKSNYSTSGTTLTFSTAPPDDVLVEAIINTNTSSTTANQLIDADSDTLIQVEESSDEDTIRMDIEGSEVAVLNSTSLTLKNPATADNSTFNLNLQTAEADIAADDVLAKISFSSPNEGTGTDALLTAAAIQAISEGDFSSSSNATSLSFMTGASEAAAEKMRLTSAGNVGIGTTSPATAAGISKYLHIDGGDPGIVLKDSTANDVAEIYNAGGKFIIYGGSGGTNADVACFDLPNKRLGIGTISPAAELHVSAATTTQIRCESTTNSSTSTVQLATNGSDWNLSAGGSAQGTYPNGFYIYDAGADATRLIINDSGRITMPAQPAFLAVPASTQSNIAVTTDVAVAFGTEIFDVSGHFASNTFTAPVTGKYQLNVDIRMQTVDSAAGYYQLMLVTSNKTYFNVMDPDFGQDAAYWTISLQQLVDMDASDTATIQIHQSSGTAQTDISTASYFSGFLAC